MPPSFSIVFTNAAPLWVALALAATVAVLAWRSGSLRADGAVAAFAIGVIAVRVQWAWGAYLLGWFVLASALSRVGRARKATRTREIVLKGDTRDARQVLANGGIFAICALVVLIADAVGSIADARSTPSPLMALATLAAGGALAASGADTWSTEIGTLLGGNPWSLRRRQRVTPGTSGAVTWSGTIGGVVGAVLLSGFAWSVSMIASSMVLPVALGAVVGATVDTLLGAWVQERRLCSVCQQFTERLAHCDGMPTLHQGGIPRLDNDLVNVACSLTGAVMAVALAAFGHGRA